jgi:hypothetical protein
MTLCIAALASIPSPVSRRIVLCFDYKIANDAWGSESEYKFHVLSEQLVALVAGSPAKAKELATLYREHLATVVLSMNNALDELRKPILEFKRRKADFYIRSKLAVSYLEFLNNGEAWFGASRVAVPRRDREESAQRRNDHRWLHRRRAGPVPDDERWCYGVVGAGPVHELLFDRIRRCDSRARASREDANA